MASPLALTLPAAAPARHFPISRRGRRVPRRQHPTGPLGGRDVRPCAGARSAARSGRASIVARDGPGLTISTVMDVPYMPAPRDTPDTAEERPPCDQILGASPPRTLFPSPHPQQTTQNHSFRAGSKGSWTKRGKYEYCYHFSSRQNHPKWRSCGSARPFQLTRMAGLGLGDPLLINRFLTMFIIFLVVNAIGKATVLIFGIFCPLPYN
mgnify:CR=1 FL=1